MSNITELCTIMKSLGSDKGDDWHNFTVLYHELFRDFRTVFTRVFELGIGSQNPEVPSRMTPNYTIGASLRGWRQYFSNAHIYGADIDRDVVFREDRITCFQVDQTCPESIRNLWRQPEVSNIEFDLIIDDGLHTTKANICFFENSYHKLARNGVYVIEDIKNSAIRGLEAYFWRTAKKSGFAYHLVPFDYHKNRRDNNILFLTSLNSEFRAAIENLNQSPTPDSSGSYVR
jgi:hypothetical protein